MTLLEHIRGPADVKALPAAQLPALAQEIRELIINVIKVNGGHMASNLGVVELTIAVHRVFDSPQDTILFDVSHQSYVHKLLTGRRPDFERIRTTGGYSGYFDVDESDHDVLTLGHAGCAPSIALGLAIGEQMAGGQGATVCVIGDGGLTSGLAYEGLSNIIAYKPRNLMIILNDNGMAISPNVGWLAGWRDHWLPRLRDKLELDTDFQAFERVAQTLAPKVPFGPLALDLGRGMKSAVQRGLIPEVGRVWDEMGFNYLGPVNGHDIAALIDIMEAARQHSDKVPFVHVVTQKGKGWPPSESDPVRYHQPGPANHVGARPTYSQVFAQELGAIMDENPKVVAISAAMLEGTGLAPLKARFPDRVFDVGICEQHAVSMAAGMARGGLRPVVAIYSTFLQRAFDQVVHDVCMNDLPVVFAIDRAGLVGMDGRTHHGLFDLAYMRLVPNMVVSVPRDEHQLRRLLRCGLSQAHPFCLRYPRGEVPGIPDTEIVAPLEVGQWEALRWGRDTSIIAVGELGYRALEAAEVLAADDPPIDVQVLDPVFLKPLSPDFPSPLSHFRDVFVLEDGAAVGGARAAVLEAMAEQEHPPRVHGLSTGDSFPGHGDMEYLRRECWFTADLIAQFVRDRLMELIVLGGDA